MAAKYAGYYVDKPEGVVEPIPNAEAAAQRLDELLTRVAARQKEPIGGGRTN
jgi:hypothetical protein